MPMKHADLGRRQPATDDKKQLGRSRCHRAVRTRLHVTAIFQVVCSSKLCAIHLFFMLMLCLHVTATAIFSGSLLFFMIDVLLGLLED
jgi:hypothetical protein